MSSEWSSEGGEPTEATSEHRTVDAPEEWILTDGGLMGGYVCSACGMPTESEPCQLHQPNAYARFTEHTAGT